MWIKTYILTIIVVVLLSHLADSLMPDNNMKKHISLVCGLIVLLTIAKPFVALPKTLTTNFDLSDSRGSLSSIELSEKLICDMESTIDSEFCTNLNKTINDDLQNRYNRSFKTKTIKADKTFYLKIYEKEDIGVKNYIETTYGIMCEFTEGGADK